MAVSCQSTSVQLSQQNLPLIPSSRSGVARGEITQFHAEFTSVPQPQWRGEAATPTASVCDAASGGNIRAVSQHLVSTPGKHPREAPQPEHLCAFPEHLLPCASPALPILGKNQSICRTCWWGCREVSPGKSPVFNPDTAAQHTGHLVPKKPSKEKGLSLIHI